MEVELFWPYYPFFEITLDVSVGFFEKKNPLFSDLVICESYDALESKKTKETSI